MPRPRYTRFVHALRATGNEPVRADPPCVLKFTSDSCVSVLHWAGKVLVKEFALKYSTRRVVIVLRKGGIGPLRPELLAMFSYERAINNGIHTRGLQNILHKRVWNEQEKVKLVDDGVGFLKDYVAHIYILGEYITRFETSTHVWSAHDRH